MNKAYSRWGVTALGLVLVVFGILAMIAGWDIIQVERGWSLFIGGASAVAGGAVVVALGQVVARLDAILATADRGGGEPALESSEAHPQDARRPAKPREESSESALDTAAEEASRGETLEVDRYESGDVTYVMYSDGSVEVRTAEGAHRYASLAELRAQAAQQ